MDVTFNNVLEGTRQYFLGLPKQTGSESAGQQMWASGAPLHEEGAPAQSGAPAPSSRPPSAAAAPPSTPGPPATLPPPRPPSEPLEPEPHIIHKATVMREAMEKRRDQPEPDDDDDPSEALSPPSHIIRRPMQAPHTLPSPAPAPAAPSPSPARPPSGAPQHPTPAPEPHAQPPPPEQAIYRPPSSHLQMPTSRPQDHYIAGRPPDPNSASRPPEAYVRYHYEANIAESGRSSQGPPSASPQPSTMTRQSPQQTYGRISSSLPMHTAARIRESPSHSSPAPRYAMPTSQPPPPPHNDRVPPIHHPPSVPPQQRLTPVEGRAAQAYASSHQRREVSPYGRPSIHYDRHATVAARKYDPQQAYPGYRPAPTAPQPAQNHRVEAHHHVPGPYKHTTMESLSAHYATRPPERVVGPSTHETARLPRVDYNISRNVDSRSSYHYPSPSTSTSRYQSSSSVPVPQSSSLPSRSTYRPVPAPAPAPAAAPAPAPAPAVRPTYDYLAPNQVQTPPARSTAKPVLANQQSRLTVSVTTLVNQMNQTKHKRESPLDLSVKTVKNSADSSTTQDDMVDSASMESKTVSLQPRPISSSRHVPVAPAGYVSSHKVDFAPDFQSQYRDRASHSYNHVGPPGHVAAGQPTVRYNGAFEPPRPAAEPYAVESRQPTYADRNKYHAHAAKSDYVHRIDLTRPAVEERLPDSRIRDDRHFIIEERKRSGGQIVSNIPEKIFRHETYVPDSRTDRINRSAREQQKLMSQPVYSYSSYKHQHEQKMSSSQAVPSPYRDPQPQPNHRYPPYPAEPPARVPVEYHNHYLDRHSSSSSRHVIQKVHSHRELPPHHQHHHHHQHLDHSGVPADKRVLSILRNSLQKQNEIKQTGYLEPARPARHVPDLIVIDDADDVIEITDEVEMAKSHPKPIQNHVSPIPDHSIHLPKAVNSITRDQRYDNLDPKSRSPENDVASRIRTKAELKGIPLPEESSSRPEMRQDSDVDNDKGKLQPKSQKQHLFNQIREENLRLESVIKTEQQCTFSSSEVKTEPMNIEEIEKDAIAPIKIENNLEPLPVKLPENAVEDDLDWAFACDSFMEQLKSGCHKKRRRKRVDTENDSKTDKPSSSSAHNLTPTLSSEALEETTVPEQKSTEFKEEPKELQDLNGTKVTELKEDKIIEPKETKVLETTAPKEIEAKLQQNQDENLTGVKELESEVKKPETELKKPETEVKKPEIMVKKPEENKSKKLVSKEPDAMLPSPPVTIKQEPLDEDEFLNQNIPSPSILDVNEIIHEKKQKRKIEKGVEKPVKITTPSKNKDKTDKKRISSTTIEIKKEPIKTVIKTESESTDDDEPLIKSKLLKEKEKEKEQSDRLKYQLLKDLSEKSAYVKLECFDVNNRRSFDASGCTVATTDHNSISKERDILPKGKLTRQVSRSKGKSLSTDKNEKVKEEESSTDSEDDVNIASRLRLRKSVKTEKTEDKTASVNKTPVKSSPKKQDLRSNNSTPIRKPGFGDGSDFHPGWEEELYRYKRSLRMPTRLIAIPRGRSGGPPFVRGSGGLFARGSTSLPDLDPAPLSPAPSSAPSAATDDLYARRQANIAIDSDLDSNSSYSAPNRLHYDSEASTSTVFSMSKGKKKRSSIVDVLIQRVGKKEDSKKKSKEKHKEGNTPKVIPKNPNELLPTPSLGLLKNGSKGSLSAKKEKMMEDIFYLGAFRKETVSAFRNEFINTTDGLIGATEEFSPVVLKTRTRTESRVLKQRATIKEVFGDDRPASAPPSSCREEVNDEDETIVIKKEKEPEPEAKPKPTTKSKKIVKDKIRRSSSIRDGLRSNLVKRNDAKGRLLRLKKRNNLMKKSLSNKRIKDFSAKHKKEKSPTPDDDKDKDKPKEENASAPQPEGNKKRFKRLFGRRKFSSGFDYIRKKKKIIRREDGAVKVRRPAPKPRDPESVHDIQKEIKGWFVNKSIGETPLHRAARLGYTDCVAYCLEKMGAEASSKDNAGFTPLHVAAAKGHVRIARLLLQYGANVSAAAQGGIRPLHEASENSHVEMIRLLLSYGADPILGTYAGQTPIELAEGSAGRLLRLHIADVQGHAVEPWTFPPPAQIIADPEELGCDPLSSPPPASPPPAPDCTVEIQCTEAPLPPFYSLKGTPGQPAEGLWCLLQDITTILQIKSKESLLKQIHCGSGSPKELLREIRTQEFLERAQCHQLLCAGEKVNVRASKVALVRVTDKLRQLLKVETVLVS